MKIRLLTVIMTFILLFTLSCATAMGPLFKEVGSDEYKGKAVVYVFRNSFPSGAWVYDLKINDKDSLPLPNKGYHLLILEPGTYEFKVFYSPSKIQAENRFIFQAGGTYFIRYWAKKVGLEPVTPFALLPGGSPGYIISEGITLVLRKEALEVIKNCRFMEVKKK